MSINAANEYSYFFFYSKILILWLTAVTLKHHKVCEKDYALASASCQILTPKINAFDWA